MSVLGELFLPISMARRPSNNWIMMIKWDRNWHLGIQSPQLFVCFPHLTSITQFLNHVPSHSFRPSSSLIHGSSKSPPSQRSMTTLASSFLIRSCCRDRCVQHGFVVTDMFCKKTQSHSYITIPNWIVCSSGLILGHCVENYPTCLQIDCWYDTILFKNASVVRSLRAVYLFQSSTLWTCSTETISRLWRRIRAQESKWPWCWDLELSSSAQNGWENMENNWEIHGHRVPSD